MLRRKRWEVIRLQASPAKFIGYVAHRMKRPREVAIEQFQVRPEQQRVALDPKGMVATDRCRGASVGGKLSCCAEPVAPCQDARAIAKQHHAAWISREQAWAFRPDEVSQAAPLLVDDAPGHGDASSSVINLGLFP
jgi:hypothetical protein